MVSGWDTYNNNYITTDDTHSHGTHVAGTIGAVGNNNIGVAGVNWNVSLVPLQAANTVNRFYASDVVKAIQWAESKWGTSEQISVLNYSVGGFGSTTSVREAIKGYHGLFVWAAGNGDKDVDTEINQNGSFDLPNLISVGALKSNGQRPDVSDWGYDSDGNPQGSNYSSSGANVNIYAPGNNIYSTVLNDGYGSKSGTSMAAPHVSGVAALLLSKNSNLTPSQLKSIILKSANDVYISVKSSSGNTFSQKAKKLNAYEAVNSVVKGYEESISINWQGGSGGSTIVNVKDNSPMPKITAPTRAGYKLDGYFASDGTQFYDGNMNSVRNWSIMYDTTLYARWTPIQYRVYICNAIYDTWKPIKGEDFYSFDLNYDEERTVTAPSYVSYNFKFWVYYNNYRDVNVPIDQTKFPIYSYDRTITIKNLTTNDNEGWDVVCCYEVNNCIAENSLITLADGTAKPVEELTGNEMLLVWDMQTGMFASAPILFIDIDDAANCQIINLSFSDGTTVKVIYEHAFWDCNLNEYVFLREDAAQYIGHWFNKQIIDENGNLTWGGVQLTDVIITQEYTAAYSPVTYSYLCYYVNGMLTMPGATEGLINIFEVNDTTMTYDQAAFAEDIETYGIFTYEEFVEVLPVSEEVFNAFNGQYLKVAIGKGLITIDDLVALYSRYSQFFD